MTNDPKFAAGPPDLGSLPEWAQRAVKSALAPVQSPGIAADRNSKSWPLLVEAAVVSGFLPRDLAPGIASGEERSAAEQNVVEFAEPFYSVDGPRWSLRPEARAAILNVAISAGDVTQAVQRTAQWFPDAVSKAIRRCLAGAPETSVSESMEELEARRLASTLLSGLTSLNLNVAGLDQEIELRRLLAPFERMVGTRAATAAGSPPQDRFFGRTVEMTQLRDFVGVLTGGFAGSIRQVKLRVAAAISGRQPVCIFGIGGAGKTTLIAKFMLEHAASQQTRFPFAYLDFDRSTVSARDTVGLFSEICSQVGIQFPELAQKLADLRSHARDTAKRVAVSQQGASTSYLQSDMMIFRSILDGYLDNLESAWEWARPFLLVFDTFEVAQYSPDDVAELETFVRGFAPSENALWPRLRLVIAGRKQVTSFAGMVEDIPLDELDRQGSVSMLVALANDAGKPLPERDAIPLIGALAKAYGSKTGGLRPLRLRLLGELFRNKDLPGDGPSVAASLVAEFNRPLNRRGIAGKVLIDGLLTRRVLTNVVDDRVRALADPGLVVRRITPEVIREVMTKCSVKPEPRAAEESAQTAPTEWVVSQTEAQQIYEAFKKEVSLVEEDAGVLRHRQDVRLDMLPLIRAQSESQFMAIHRMAYQFFSARLKGADVNANRAEAIYHGLWLGEPLDQLNSLWADEPPIDPRIDPEEFPNDSAALAFLRAKHGERLAPAELQKLSTSMQLEWLSRWMPDFMTEQRVSSAVESLRAIGLEDVLLPEPQLAADSVRLLYRGGFWSEAMKMVGQSLRSSVSPDLKMGIDEPHTSIARTGMTIAAKSDNPPLDDAVERLLQIMQEISDPLARFEMHAHWALGSVSGRNFREVEQIRTRCGELASQVEPREWQHNRRILRLAILTIPPGDYQRQQLLSWYLDGLERLPRERRAAEFRQRLLMLLDVDVKDAERASSQEVLPESLMREWDRKWQARRKERPQLGLGEPDLSRDLWWMIAHDHPDWTRPFGNALTRLLEREDGERMWSSFAKQGYIPPNLRDAFAAVQYVYDQGRLLDFAETLARSGKPQPGFPQDAYGIAEGLLDWQDRINRLSPFKPAAAGAAG